MKRWCSAVAAVVALGVGGASPALSASSHPSTGAQSRGGTLRIVAEGDVGNLDTSQAYEVVAWTLDRAFTRQLVSYAGSPASLAKDVTPVPDLARTVQTSADGLTYTFRLRDGVHYSGPTTRAIRSGDFAYALKRLCDPNGTAGALVYYTATIKGLQSFCDGFATVPIGYPDKVKDYIDGHPVAGITTPDDSTVVFSLTQRSNDFLNILALPFATPQPEEVVSPYLTDSYDFRQHVVSSGPYTLTRYVQGRSFDFARTPDYSSSLDPLRHAYADRITVDETVGTDDSEFEQIRSGTADLSLDVTAPPEPLVRELRAEHDATIRVSPEGRVDYLVFNVRPRATSSCAVALRKVAVRRAFAYAVDKQSAALTLGGSPGASPTGQLLTSTITGYRHADRYATTGSRGNPAKAKAMLAAAGYPHGLTCTYLYRAKSRGADLATFEQHDLARAGIRLKLHEVPNADFYAKHLQLPSADDWDLAFPGWSPDWQGNAGRSLFSPLVATNCTQGTTNYGCFSDPALDRAITASLASKVPAKGNAGIDALLSTDEPIVPMVERSSISIVSRRLHGFRWLNYADNADIANVSVR